MKAALRRYAEGTRTRLPVRLSVHLVAQTYGQTPEDVREWPSDDFLDALNCIGMTAPK